MASFICRLICLSLLLILSSGSSAFENKRLQSIIHKSTIASHPVNFTVYLPEWYDEDPTARYPVLFTTAGSNRQKLIRQQLDWLSHVEFGPIPRLIMVSIPDIKVETTIQPKEIAASGANSKITLEVLRKEVMPYINKNYRTQPFRIIEGFSSYGNLPLYTFKNSPELFNAFISISPALVLDQSGLINDLEVKMRSNDYTYRSLYLSLGSLPNKPELFEQLIDKLKKHAPSKLSWHADYFNNDNYLTAAAMALPMALQRIFLDRTPSDLAQFDAKGIAGISAYFKQLKRKYGFEPSSISTLIDFSDRQLSQSNIKGAIMTLKHIIAVKPDSVYYHTLLAKAQRSSKQHTQATSTLNHALTLAQQQQNQDAIDYVNGLLAQGPAPK